MSKWDAKLSADIKKVNAQLTAVQRRYGADSAIFKRFVHTISLAGGETRFKKSMFEGNTRQINKALRALETVKSSKYITPSGRKQIASEARKTFAENWGNYGYDDRTIEMMLDAFGNSSMQKLLELYDFDSRGFVDAIMSTIERDNNIDKKQLGRKLDNLLKKASEFDGTKEDQIESAIRWLKS